ncbi:MAG: YaiO family outer membrane beta-barrel protein [Candidatus Marinimicrobia bacterium]|nr:YaiO family outer membrane beta-barrel protein [Candidatus Neomarinimicrobiota bacterium]
MMALLAMVLTLLVAQETAPADSGSREQGAWPAYERYMAGDSLSYEEELGLARQLAFDNRWDAAVEIYTALLTHNPNDSDVRLGRGLVYAWQGRYEEATSDLTRVTHQTPGYADAWMALGNAYLWWGRAGPAEQAYSRWMELQPDRAEPYLARSRAHQAARHFPQARKDLKLARRLGGNADEIDRLLRLLDRIPAARPWEPVLLWQRQTFSDGRSAWRTTRFTVKRELTQGSVALGLMRTNRYDMGDEAILSDVYVHLWRRAYVNVRLQLAPGSKVLPKADIAGELFQGIGQGWELSGSYRRMNFPDQPVEIYGLALIKYAGNWLLRGRGLWVPGEQGSGVYVGGAARWYLDTVDDFIELGGGRGTEINPDGTGPRGLIMHDVIFRGQHFFNRRFGITFMGNLHRSTIKNVRRGLALGLVTRW